MAYNIDLTISISVITSIYDIKNHVGEYIAAAQRREDNELEFLRNKLLINSF